MLHIPTYQQYTDARATTLQELRFKISNPLRHSGLSKLVSLTVDSLCVPNVINDLETRVGMTMSQVLSDAMMCPLTFMRLSFLPHLPLSYSRSRGIGGYW
jgi:hypothetical protein